MTDHKKRAAQNNLHGSIYDHLIEAWIMAEPRPPMGHSFGMSFTSYDPDVQQYLHDFVFRVIRGILDDGCLQQPDQPDEWEECGANDLQSGDVYRAESPDANIAYKKPIEKCAIVGDWLEVQHVGGMKSSAKISTNTFYRTPAPVVHPDPEVNHFIRINGKDYEAIPDSGRYQLIESKWSSPMVLNVEHITEWEELELIPKVVEDD